MKQVLSSWVETEQRIWLRRKWTRQLAMVETSGLLMISSPSRYDKREYCLTGAQALLVEKGQIEDTHAPLIRIALDPSLQLDGAACITFRLTSAADAAPWITTLTR